MRACFSVRDMAICPVTPPRVPANGRRAYNLYQTNAVMDHLPFLRGVALDTGVANEPARALFGRPRLLLCDEPTGNLDARTGDEIIHLFRELNREGLTLLAVTHEERMSAAAGRVLRLKEGRLVPEPPPAAGRAP